MEFEKNGTEWTWNDKSTTEEPSQYTTTTATNAKEELKIKARDWKGEFIITSPTTPTVITYGWVCPKCGCVNAPWSATCPCSLPTIKITC